MPEFFKNFFLPGIVLVSTFHLAQAWGAVGHEVVAYIAADHLSNSARGKIAALLGPGVMLASIANWADELRASSRPETAPWHFINIEDRKKVAEKDEPEFCPNHDCVVDQINLDLAALKNTAATDSQKTEALKFLTHFLGDVHQPLHCADDQDRGGNEKIVVYLEPGGSSKNAVKTNLHAFWDHLLEINTSEDPRALATRLEKHITAADKKNWVWGSAADWAWESFLIAHQSIYSEFKPGPTDSAGVPLPQDYYTSKMRSIVNLQLEKAGIRLAYLLNSL